MAKRKHYDDKFRASAVVMLEAQGYPANPYKLKEVADHIGVPERTLRRWYKGESNPPPDMIVQDVKKDLTELVRGELIAIFTAMGVVREEASYRDLGTVGGILFDKLQLIEGKPTERQEHTGEVTHRIRTIEVVRDSLPDGKSS